MFFMFFLIVAWEKKHKMLVFMEYVCMYVRPKLTFVSFFMFFFCTFPLIYMWSQENGFPHARVIYFRLCAIYAQAGCFVWCAWLLLSKVNLNWKKFSYFDPHDYHVMIIYKPVTSCIYISVGCLMTPSLVWLMSPWLTGILIDHRTLIMHFTCSLQNVGQKKAVAWNDRAIKGEEALWGWWL